MARLWSCGFELGTSTSGVEFDLASSATIVATTIRSGTYSLNVTQAASASYAQYTFSSADKAITYYRFYVNRVGSFNAHIFIIKNGANNIAYLTPPGVNDNKLKLVEGVGGTQVGSNSPVTVSNGWHCWEIMVDMTTLASSVLAARLDGYEFARGTVDLSTRSLPDTIIIGSDVGQS